MIRVVYVVNDAETGGAQTLIEGLSRSFQGAVEVHIVVLLQEGALSERFSDAADSVTYLRIARRSLNLLAAARRLRSVVELLRPDVVHSHLLQSDLLTIVATPRGVPVVSTLHTTGMRTSDPLRSRLLAAALGVLSRVRTRRIIVCGVGAEAYARRFLYPRKRLLRIDNGTDIPASPRPKVANDPTVLTLARWHPMKDYPNLLRAFALVRLEYPRAKLLCAGSGVSADNADLVELRTSVGLPPEAVIFLGPVKDTQDLFARSKVLAISSGYGEALPMAGIEAIASGTPVVTTDIGDCSRLTVRPEHLSPVEDASALGAAIASVLSAGASEYEALRNEAVAKARAEFDIVRASRHHLEVYEGLVSARSRRRHGER